ncbi:hypothetical protein PENTCL1PPCAC_1581, partial [Pristionchus entomophagus]
GRVILIRSTSRLICPRPLQVYDLPDLPPCGLSVAELFYIFLSYYSTLNLCEAVIRIKCGRISVRGLSNDRPDD